MNLADIRKDYSHRTLNEDSVSKNPMEQFSIWMDEVLTAEVPEPTAMVLSTCNNNKPHSRVVLLKGIKDNGFVFYTNYDSAKGKQIEENPFVCLNFHWAELERQVRIEGKVVKLSKEESDNYYNSRPKGSQIGAWSSPQSQVISKEELQKKVDEYVNQFQEFIIIPRPNFWGGLVVEPHTIEFWQGRPNRLHDRIRYQLINNNWEIDRLAP